MEHPFVSVVSKTLPIGFIIVVRDTRTLGLDSWKIRISLKNAQKHAMSRKNSTPFVTGYESYWAYLECAPTDGGARMHPRSGESSQLQSLKNGPTYREKFFAIFFQGSRRHVKLWR